jgi:hypothetical protein
VHRRAHRHHLQLDRHAACVLDGARRPRRHSRRSRSACGPTRRRPGRTRSSARRSSSGCIRPPLPGSRRTRRSSPARRWRASSLGSHRLEAFSSNSGRSKSFRSSSSTFRSGRWLATPCSHWATLGPRRAWRVLPMMRAMWSGSFMGLLP